MNIQIYAGTVDEPFSAKSVALWNGFSALTCEHGCMNPASLNMSRIISISSLKTPPDITHHAFLAALPQKKWRLQVEGLVSDYGLLKDFITQHVFSAKKWRLGVAAKTSLRQILSLGLKMNYSGLRIDNWKSSALTLDAGFRTQLKTGKAGLGVSIRNINLHHSENSDRLTQFLVFGVYYCPFYLPGVFSLDVDNYSGLRGVLGLELEPIEKFKIYLSNSSDYNNLQTGSIYQNFISGFGIGFQLNWIGYAFTFGSRNLGQGGWIKGVTLSKTLKNS